MAKQSLETQIAVLNKIATDSSEDIKDILKKLEEDYVTKDQDKVTQERLSRIEKIVYGVIMLIAAALVGAWFNIFPKLK